jgi:hypothetical protein
MVPRPVGARRAVRDGVVPARVIEVNSSQNDGAKNS